MNLRKDHSHIIQSHSCELVGEGLCDRRAFAGAAFVQMLKGGGASFGTSSDSFSLPVLAAKHICSSFLFSSVSMALLSHVYSFTTFSDGCLGSINDEGRSEVR